jgi:ubiquinone/menaquinone biosynthesis C-methylase UbiE
VADWITDPEAVAEEYASEDAYRQRLLAFRELVEGANDEKIVRERVRAARPRRLLDVGSGLGDLCAWAKAELEGEVTAIDSSPRMVELAAQAGVKAVLADMRKLPFDDASFDCAVASMVLYHVADPETAIAELARVLDAGGLLLASTGCDDDLERRLAWARLFDEEPRPASPPPSFSRENGRRLLLRRFRQVEQIDCDATLVFPTRERLARYVQALPLAKDMAGNVPELTEPFRLPAKATVFQASTPRTR